MGRAIQDVAAEEAGLALEPLDLRVQRPDSAGAVQAIIDFSLPAGLVEVAEFSARHRLPLISGTTGGGAALEKALDKDEMRKWMTELGHDVPDDVGEH